MSNYYYQRAGQKTVSCYSMGHGDSSRCWEAEIVMVSDFDFLIHDLMNCAFFFFCVSF